MEGSNILVILPKPKFETKVINEDVKIRKGYSTPFGMNYKTREQVNNQQIKCDHGPDPLVEIRNEYCNVCEIELTPGEKLNVHDLEHVLCPIEDCAFKCHPIILENHIGIVHAAGLYEKVKKLSTPEDIAQWRDERRKRYPSTANVEMRKKAEEQRRKRGERLTSKKKGFRSHDYKDPSDFEKRDRKKFSRERRKSKKRKYAANHLNMQPKLVEEKSRDIMKNMVECQKKITSTNSDEVCARISMFTGTSSLQNYRTTEEVARQLIKESDALVNIFGEYGSDDDSSSNNKQSDNIERIVFLNEKSNEKLTDMNLDDKIREKCNIHSFKNKKVPSNTAYDNIVKSDDDDDEGPEEVLIKKKYDFIIPRLDKFEKSMLAIRNQKSTKSIELKTLLKPKFQRKSGLNNKRVNANRYPTMLGLLLEKEIRHERNVLLQCVRFVCENNFFLKNNKT